MNGTISAVTENMDKYELGIAVGKVYDFIWDEFCDWYIEMVKPRLYAEGDAAQALAASKEAALWTLQTVLLQSMKLLHPYMPFITEEIYQTLLDGRFSDECKESIMISSWPASCKEWEFAAEEKDIETIKEAVRGIRNVRAKMNVAPSKKAKVFVVTTGAETVRIFEENKLFFAVLAHASEVTIQADRAGIAEDAVSVVLADAVLYIPLEELVDLSAEKERLEKEKKKLEQELARSKGMLSNEKFLSKAPADKIKEEQEKQAKYEQTYKQIVEQLEHFK